MTDPDLKRIEDAVNRVEREELEAARTRRLASLQITTNGVVIDRITDAQRAALVELFRDSDVTRIRVSYSFDLPTDWLHWIAEDGTLANWEGGISPDGDVAT